MTITEFKRELQQLMYLEDTNIIDVVMGSIVANSLQIGDPVWLTIIGPSSGGKSQLIRPFAMAHSEYIHRVDDLTPNTLISGSLGVDNSLLGRIGKSGIISMDDLTVLFSKNPEARGEILSQFRMVYDGHYSKSSGSKKDAMVWSGHCGLISGSTPAIYRYFGEVADMGERFVSYRMKPIDVHKAVDFVMANQIPSKEMNEKIADLIRAFLPTLLSAGKDGIPQLHPETMTAIREASEHFTLLRTPIHLDERTGLVDELPEPEMPFRVMKQLTYLARGMQALQEDPTAPPPPYILNALEWVAYSLANDKRRAYVRAITALDYQGMKISPRNVAASVGLSNEIVGRGLSQLQALGIITLAHEEDTTRREYAISNRPLCALVRKLEPIKVAVDDIE